MQRNTGKRPPMLDAHGPMPERLAYLWQWFRELRKPLSYTEIEAWARLTRRSPERWEIDALFRLDYELHEAQK